MKERPVKSKCNCSPKCDLCMCAHHFASHLSLRRYGRHVELQRASPQPSQPFRAFIEQASCIPRYRTTCTDNLVLFYSIYQSCQFVQVSFAGPECRCCHAQHNLPCSFKVVWLHRMLVIYTPLCSQCCSYYCIGNFQLRKSSARLCTESSAHL